MTMQAGIPVLGTFSIASVASGTTAVAALIPPFPGPAAYPALYNATQLNVPLNNAPVPTKANWLKAPLFGVPHITSIQTITSTTVHNFVVNRPLNWTYFPAGLAKNLTVIPNTALFDDPGVYSTNYKYPTPGGVFPAVADAAISSTNLAVCYQIADGTWRYDTIASGTFGSTLTLTTGTPNYAAGAILAGGPLFYFGVLAGTLVDPATGIAQWKTGTSTGTAGFQNYQDSGCGLVAALHCGDPLLVYDLNGTAADSFVVSGFYGLFSPLLEKKHHGGEHETGGQGSSRAGKDE